LLLYTCAPAASPVAGLDVLPHQRVVPAAGEATSTLPAALEDQQAAGTADDTLLCVLVVAELVALSAEDQAATARLSA
jgi:hypothetical protein